MTSNGLVANPTKTVFMMLNCKSESTLNMKIRIGEMKIEESEYSKLLGMKIDKKLNWK